MTPEEQRAINERINAYLRQHREAVDKACGKLIADGYLIRDLDLREETVQEGLTFWPVTTVTHRPSGQVVAVVK